MIGIPDEKQRYTVDEYLEFERAAEERHIYIDGEIFAMAGESDAHGDISVNIVMLLATQLKGTNCRVRTKDTKVRRGPAPKSRRNYSGFFSYPDVLVVCGEREFHDVNTDVIANPKAIFEVLSPSTEATDRGEKFTGLQEWNSSLTEYILVSQKQPQIEHFSRPESGNWSYQRYAGLDASFTIESIGCTLKLADVYDRVSFEDDKAEAE